MLRASNFGVKSPDQAEQNGRPGRRERSGSRRRAMRALRFKKYILQYGPGTRVLGYGRP